MRWAAGTIVFALACGTAGTISNTSSDGGTGAIVPGDAGPADAGPVDAGPPPDCAGLIPSKIGAAYTFDVHDTSCAAATSDGTGMIVARGSKNTDGTFTWYVFSGSNGAAAGNFKAGDALYPQPTGYEGYSSSWDTYWDTYGNPRNSAIVEPGAIVDRAYGSGTIAVGASGSSTVIHKVDATGNESATRCTAAVAATPLDGAEDASGAVLAVVGVNGVARGIWCDMTHGTAGAPFDIGPATAASARALIGGGIAVSLDGHWSTLLNPGDATLHAAPAWLRDGADFAAVRGSKAYALIQSGHNAIDIVSPQGSACGPITFGGVNSVSIGADGTVIGASGSTGCTKVFWQGALK